MLFAYRRPPQTAQPGTKLRIKSNEFKRTQSTLACGVGCFEAFLLYGSVRLEHHERLVAGRNDAVRQLAATKSAQTGRITVLAVVDGNIVVGALLMWLHVEFAEINLDPMARSGGEVPRTILFVGIKVGIIGTGYLSGWIGDVVRASALLAIVLVLVQHKTIVALANVRSDRVAANVLTPTIVVLALVLVCYWWREANFQLNTSQPKKLYERTCEELQSKSKTLHRIVRSELQSQTVAH